MNYKSCIVLFGNKHCKYCKLAKQALSEFKEIKQHDIEQDGWPDFCPAAPSLFVFGAEGQVLDSVSGYKIQSVYIRFLHKHKEVLFND